MRLGLSLFDKLCDDVLWIRVDARIDNFDDILNNKIIYWACNSILSIIIRLGKKLLGGLLQACKLNHNLNDKW